LTVEKSQIEALVYLVMVGVLLGLYKGDRNWGRTLLWVSFVTLCALLLMFAPVLFPGLF
jgi:hypothetical protein